jgi:hypothetical protein
MIAAQSRGGALEEVPPPPSAAIIGMVDLKLNLKLESYGAEDVEDEWQ